MRQSYFNKREKKQVPSKTSGYCVSQKKGTNGVISHLSQKQLEKAKQHKYRRNLKFMFPRFRFIREHFFLTGWVQSSDIISCVSLRIKSITWSFQRETNPV